MSTWAFQFITQYLPRSMRANLAYILVTENLLLFLFLFFGEGSDPGNEKWLEDWSMKYILAGNVLILYKERDKGLETPAMSDLGFWRLTNLNYAVEAVTTVP